jgi:hypothetical protein
MIGAKRDTEDADFYSRKRIKVVGERSVRDEGKGVTHAGAYRSENVGTSNRNASEILARRKNKVSFAMEINEGLVGPKPMANAEGDGHMVNIP